MMKEPVNTPVPAITFHTGAPRSRSMATITPIVSLPLTVMAKLSGFAVADPFTRPLSRWSAALVGATSSFVSVSGIGDPESTRR